MDAGYAKRRSTRDAKELIPDMKKDGSGDSWINFPCRTFITQGAYEIIIVYLRKYNCGADEQLTELSPGLISRASRSRTSGLRD